MGRRTNTPYTLGTSNRIRNIIISIVVLAVIGGGVFYALYREPVEAIDNTAVEMPEVVVQADTQSMNTPQRACEAINAYYTALAANDSGKLAEMGSSAAANAIQAGWLKSMDYSVDSEKLTTASRADFPAPAGMWAGNTLYNIAEFYPAYPENSIRNNVTGLSGPVGWVYFDTMQGHWTITDPTIPTAINAAQSNTVVKSSSNKLVTVKVQSVGALANPWWCVAQVGVSISSTSTDSEVTLSPRGFDEGITLNIPPNLTQNVSIAQEAPAPGAETQETATGSENPSADPSQPAASTTVTSVSKITPQKLNGVCVIYRGILSDFGINKIGSPPLTLEGDIMPLDISTAEENITPIFPIGNATIEEIQKTMTQEEVDRYNATNADLPAIPKLHIENRENGGE